MFQLDAVFYTDYEVDTAISNLMEHSAFLALVIVRAGILVVGTGLLIMNFAPIEATRDKTGYYGQLD